jgi:Fe-S cluster assembly protein SufD
LDKVVQIKEGKNSFSFAVKKNLNLVLTAVHIKNADVNLRVILAGKGSSATITGIIIGSKEEKISLHTMQVHEAPETTSDLLIKSVLSDHARCLYDGGIRVEKKAQKTNAYQRNENLLLTGRPYAESKPALEILANDVRCTHGSTTGPIDTDQLWYLSSRGIGEAAARRLIARGFIGSALMRVGDESIIQKLWQTLYPR